MPLSVSFWAYLVGSNIVISLITMLLRNQLIQAHAAVFYLSMMALSTGWFIFTLIGTWRSNDKHNQSIVVKFVVRIVLCLGWAKIALYTMIIGGAFLLPYITDSGFLSP